MTSVYLTVCVYTGEKKNYRKPSKSKYEIMVTNLNTDPYDEPQSLQLSSQSERKLNYQSLTTLNFI